MSHREMFIDSGDRRKKALLVAHYADHSTAFAALFLARAGFSVVVSTTSEQNPPWGDHQVAMRFIRQLSNVLVVDEEALAGLGNFGGVYLWWRHPHQYPKEVIGVIEALARKSDRKLLFYNAQFGNQWQLLKAQARDLAACWGLLAAFEEVASTHTGTRVGLFNVCKGKKVTPVECGLEFVFKEHLSERLYENWDPARRRGFFLQAGGGLSVVTGRAEIAETLSAYFSEAGVTLTSDMRSKEGSKSVLWCWNDATIPFEQYPGALRDSDFSLCLNGYTWTSRVAEAVICGCVPILDTKYLEHYGLPFEDGVNCLIVEGDCRRTAWREAVERARRIPEDKLVEMRENLKVLRSGHLSPTSYADRYRRLLDLDVGGTTA